jgi:F-type H+-transporting ATPase subunit b
MQGFKYAKGYILLAIFLICFGCLGLNPVIAEEAAHAPASANLQTTGHGEGQETEHEGDRKGDLLDLLYRFINFALLVIILFIVIKKSPIKGFFAARGEEIRKKLDDLKKEKEEAESRYQEIERQLRDFDEKRRDIIDQYKKEGLAEKERIIAEANERVKQIIDQSELTIQQEIQAARDKLKQDIVELAAQKASEIMANKIDERDQDNLIDEFIERLGKTH